MSDRRFWLWFAAATGALLLVALLLAPASRQYATDIRLSSLRTTPDGAGALYETLRALDVPVGRRLTPLAGADSLDGTLVLLAPTEPLSPREIDALLAWVEDGGDAIVTVYPLDPILTALGYSLRWGRRADVTWVPDTARRAMPAKHEWTGGMGPVGPFLWAFDTVAGRDSVPATSLVQDPSGGSVALLLEREAGRILLISEPGQLSNAQIDRTGWAPLVARAAVAMTEPGDTVWFDEFHHGHRGGTVGAAVWTFLTGHSVGLLLLQLAVVLVLALLPLTLRFGAPVELPRAARRTPLEHVAALGSVYRQARAQTIARRRLLAGFARRIGREGARPGDEGPHLERLAERVPVGGDEVRALARAWQDQDTDLIELSDRIDDAVQTLRR